MGRNWKSSMPTETSATGTTWQATGDDSLTNQPVAGYGWLYTIESFDWKGRPVVSTNTDGTDRLYSYQGCGCAGNQITTIKSEIVPTTVLNETARRTQKIYQDWLGRTSKTEVMLWEGTTSYTTTVNSFNVRDQITMVRQYDGAQGSSNFQDVTMTFDGYGRLQTRHNPEEDLNTNTSWDYFTDGSVQKITDPRGAITNFTYNGRGLVTNITYTSPNMAQIPATPSAAFMYDAVGSRTQMDDGPGVVNYSYNELSHLISETRQFDALTGNGFSINYAYYAGGVLKEIKDPTDATRDILYAYNKAGILTGISSTGGVQYLQNRKVRAFGAVKREDYGNGAYLEQEYDSRRRISVYNMRKPNQDSIMKIQYEYTASNDLKRAENVLNSDMSRSFEYDQVGRLTRAATNSLPEVGPASSQWMSYDVWDNLTARGISMWSGSEQGYIANYFNTYGNNRNTRTYASFPQAGTSEEEFWQYDAAGNPLVTGGQTHKYDASGQKIESVDTPPAPPAGQDGRTQLLIQQTFDGDGNSVNRYEYETFSITSPRTSTVYSLRSTVLGGRELTSINEQGQRGNFIVYGASGEATLSGGSGQVILDKANAPLIGTEFQVLPSGAMGSYTEYDTFGGEIKIEPPTPTTPPDWLYAGTYSSSGNPFDGNGGCLENGFPQDCAQVVRLACHGNPRCMGDGRTKGFGYILGGFKVKSWQGTSGRVAPRLPADTNGTDDQPIVINQQGDGGNWIYSFLPVSFIPQTQQSTPYSNIAGLRTELQRRLNLNSDECRKKLNSLLNALRKNFSDKKSGTTGFDALAEKFLSGKNKLLEKMGGLSNYDPGTKKITMNIDPTRGAGFMTPIEVQGIEFIHESLHGAAKSGFYHRRIVEEIAGIEGINFTKLEAGQRAEDIASGKTPNDSSLFEAPMNAWIQKYCGGDATQWNNYYQRYR